MNFIKSYFQLDKYNTSIKTEFIAGLTTFISMSYILFVNPSVLGASGMDTGAVFTSTALGWRSWYCNYGNCSKLSNR